MSANNKKDLSSKTKEPPVQKTSRPAHGEQKRKMTFKERREMELLEQDIVALESEKKNIEEALCSGALSVEELTDKSKRYPSSTTNWTKSPCVGWSWPRLRGKDKV